MRPQAWRTAKQEIRHITATSANSELLAENCVLISLEHGLATLSRLISIAEDAQCAHRALFFEEPPQWVRSPVA